MGRHHHHDPPAHGSGEEGSRALRTAFFLNLAFTLVEVVGGVFTASVAVLSDAVHDLGDCLVLGAAWYLQRVAGRGRDARFSYGYARFSMLGGWMTAVVLIAGSVWMLATAIPRLSSPGAPHATGMMVLAVFGIAMNGLAAWRLRGKGSLNQRGARLHLLEDVLGWGAVLIGGAVIRSTGWSLIDPLLSIGISMFILVNAIRTLRTGTGILMQGQPGNTDTASIHAALRAIHHVRDVHDQHAWSLDGSYTVLTVHLVVDDLALNAHAVKQHARAVLTDMGIDHATIELESTDEVCELQDH